MEGTNNYKEPCINEISVDLTNINCVISIITVRESDETFDVISRDYFITKGQKVDINFKKNEGEKWDDGKRKVNDQIDNDLKTMMTVSRNRVEIQ